MDGVLVVDKPEGLTSHDVVAAARRIIGERRIGHTGTLDPLATGVLPLACGRATRLVRFLSASDKEYEATILFGLTTDSYDVSGRETSRSGRAPAREAVLAGLVTLQGERLQTPPAFSAKKVDGRRAYDLARDDKAPVLSPVPVHLARATLTDLSDARAVVSLTCSAGYYVRSFAHGLGELVGTGACLEALRRTRSGEFGLSHAMTLDRLDAAELVPLGALLTTMPAVTVSDEGLQRVSHGRVIEPDHYAGAAWAEAPGWVRILDQRALLVALGRPGGLGSLHPEVVLI